MSERTEREEEGGKRRTSDVYLSLYCGGLPDNKRSVTIRVWSCHSKIAYGFQKQCVVTIVPRELSERSKQEISVDSNASYSR